VFKVRAYKGILEKSTSEFVGHHECRLGKWYDDGLGKRNFSHLPSYQSLNAPHKEVHDSIMQCANLMSDSNTQELSALMANAERSSTEVMQTLDKLIKEEKEHRNAKQSGDVMFF
jgi:hypothetical protein